jgi:hypothetical protein
VTLPTEIIAAVEHELDGLSFGGVSLLIQVHDGRLRYVIAKERSIIPGHPMSGAEKQRN